LMKRLLSILIWGSLVPLTAQATGMAVGLPNLYLQNNTNQEKLVTVKNLSKEGIEFGVPAKSICRVNGPIMFQPFEEESNNFVIMVENDKNIDPVVIDKTGMLTLAHNAMIPFNYAGNVKNYSLIGYCGNKLGQYRFLEVTPRPADGGPPIFGLANCSLDSSFVYFINDGYAKVKNRKKSLKFSKIRDCKVSDD
jgi:hypothetical protein